MGPDAQCFEAGGCDQRLTFTQELLGCCAKVLGSGFGDVWGFRVERAGATRVLKKLYWRFWGLGGLGFISGGLRVLGIHPAGRTPPCQNTSGHPKVGSGGDSSDNTSWPAILMCS